MGETGVASFEALEAKINKAAELIERLRQEKNTIEADNKELKGKMESLYIKNEELEKELKRLQKTQKGKKDSDSSREEIKKKIEEMLAKLNQLDV
jgi:DNA repair ATPase RecN